MPTAAPPQFDRFETPWVQLRSAGPGPFVYQKMVRTIDLAARPGDIVSVYDRDGKRIGRGLFHPQSQIAIRLLTWGDRPADDAFWSDRIHAAVRLRRQLRIDDASDAYRLIHAEGDGLSGLIAERYADTLVFEVFSLGMFQRIASIARLAGEALGPPSSLDRPQKAAAAWHVVVRADEKIQHIEGFRIDRDLTARAAPLTIREHGVRYRVDVAGGHKTGFFCDQRDNRRKLATLCRDATVLDVCCYSGGFSVAARTIGGAKEVVGVDLDEAAIAMARENANLNQTRIDFVHADGFAYLRQMIANRRTFDIVVLDPPKFAPSREDYDEALSKYYDLNCLGIQCVRPGGLLLTCSCSGLVSADVFLDTLHRAVRRCNRECQLLEVSGAAADHPVMMNCPESAYLKAVWCRLL